MRNYDPFSPYFTRARFDSICPETGKQIKKGDEIAYYPKHKKAYHPDSKAASGLRSLQATQALGLADADW
jgi:hypothetical protein